MNCQVPYAVIAILQPQIFFYGGKLEIEKYHSPTLTEFPISMTIFISTLLHDCHVRQSKDGQHRFNFAQILMEIALDTYVSEYSKKIKIKSLKIIVL